MDGGVICAFFSESLLHLVHRRPLSIKLNMATRIISKYWCSAVSCKRRVVSIFNIIGNCSIINYCMSWDNRWFDFIKNSLDWNYLAVKNYYYIWKIFYKSLYLFVQFRNCRWLATAGYSSTFDTMVSLFFLKSKIEMVCCNNDTWIVS